MNKNVISVLGSVVFLGIYLIWNQQAWTSQVKELELENQRLIERLPEDVLLKIQSRWEGHFITALTDDYLFVLDKSPSFAHKMDWFIRDDLIVGHNGKVLMCNGPNQPVTLAFHDEHDPRQKWMFLENGSDNYEMISYHEGLKLDLLEEPLESDVVRVGTRPPKEDDVFHLTTLWRFHSIGSEEVLVLDNDDQ